VFGIALVVCGARVFDDMGTIEVSWLRYNVKLSEAKVLVLDLLFIMIIAAIQSVSPKLAIIDEPERIEMLGLTVLTIKLVQVSPLFFHE
jgi:hypothetical protein